MLLVGIVAAAAATGLTELPIEVPGMQSTLALQVSGPDLRREDGRQAGDVGFISSYLFCS